MKRKAIFILFLCIVILAATVWAYGENAEELLITKGYLHQIFAPKLQQEFQRETEESAEAFRSEFTERMEDIYYSESSEAIESIENRELDLSYGDLLRLYPYTTLRLMEGTGKATVLSGELLDLSEGTVCAPKTLLQGGRCCFTAEESFVNLQIYSDTAKLMIRGTYACTPEADIPMEERFIDVSSEQWFAPYVWQLAEQRIVSGISKYSFQPSSLITRAAFVTILGRMCHAEPMTPTEERFSDVPVQEWYAPYVEWASEAGIVNGYSDGSFRPNQSVSREQMAAMLFRFMEYEGYEAVESGEAEAFRDEAEISDYALEAVRRIRAEGIINGRENQCFDPTGTATRAEACAVACRLLEKTKERAQ